MLEGRPCQGHVLQHHAAEHLRVAEALACIENLYTGDSPIRGIVYGDALGHMHCGYGGLDETNV